MYMHGTQLVVACVLMWPMYTAHGNCEAGSYYEGWPVYLCMTCNQMSYCPGDDSRRACLPGTHSSYGESACHACTGCASGSRVWGYCKWWYPDIEGAAVWAATYCVPCSTPTCTNGQRAVGTCSSAYNAPLGGNDYYCGGSIAGWYLPPAGGVATKCPLGTYSTANDVSSCTVCAAGTYYTTTTTGASSNSICLACPVGKYSSAGATACTLCPVGTYRPSTGGSQCMTCPPGTESTATGASACQSCAAGKFSQTGTCVACQTGTFAASTGSAACLSCGPGNYGSSTSCIPCPIGTASAPHSHETQTNH